jgi:hypothetical protein
MYAPTLVGRIEMAGWKKEEYINAARQDHEVESKTASASIFAFAALAFANWVRQKKDKEDSGIINRSCERPGHHALAG